MCVAFEKCGEATKTVSYTANRCSAYRLGICAQSGNSATSIRPCSRSTGVSDNLTSGRTKGKRRTNSFMGVLSVLRPNATGANTLSIPSGSIRVEDNCPSTSSIADSKGATRARYNLPISVNDRCLVLRWSKRAPRRASSANTRRLATAVDILSRLAPTLNPPSFATATNARID